MSQQVVIASQVFAHPLKDILEKLLPSISFTIVPFENAVVGKFQWDMQVTEGDLNQLSDAEILITDNVVIGQLAYSLPKLKWIQGTFAGVDVPFQNLTKDVLDQQGPPKFIATRYTGDSYGHLMFEYSLSYIISKERGFRDHQLNQSTKDWLQMRSVTPGKYRLLSELTVSILGIGSIGVVMSKLFKKMGCRIKGYSRTQKSREYLEENCIDEFSTSISDVIRKTDYIISVLPHTPDTIKLLDNKLDVCQDQPVFINVGRGSVISSSEIIRSLDQGFLSLAVLDVFEEEPLPTSSDLWIHPKVIVTPHIAAETRPQDLAKVFIDNYQNFVSGQPLNYVINWSSGY